MKLKILAFIMALGSLSGYAQQHTQTVRGTVVDQDSRAPLFGVNIVVVNSDPFIGTTSDMDGNFKLENVPVGRHDIKLSYIGYKESTVANLEVNAGKEVILNLQLVESISQLKEATVVAESNKKEALNEMTSISSRQFSVEETGRYAGSRNDVSRMAASYAGVSNANDSRNDIVIRGNSPNGLLWRMEGMDIPSPNHFSSVGSNGGPISMLNYNVISNSDFLTSAFPSEYGNALSGVFDIKLRNGNNQKREYMFQLGALGTEFMVEGPFSKDYNGSYLINYRFSTTSILTRMGIDFGFSGTADYQDVSFKFNLPTEKAGTFSIFGLGGNNVYKVNADERLEDSFDETVADNTNDIFENSLAIGGVNHRYLFKNNKTFINTTVGFSGQLSSGRSDSVSTLNEGLTEYYRADNNKYRFTIHSYVKTKFNSKNTLKTGVIAEQQSFELKEQLYDPAIGSMYSYKDADGSAELIQAYSQWQHKFSDNLVLNTGIHYQRFLLNDAQTIEPRVGMRWKVRPNQSINAGYGLHSQLQILPTYFVGTFTPEGVINTNENLDFSKSHHFVIGYDNALTENTVIKLEAYYQMLFDVPVHRDLEPSSFSLVNEGGSFVLHDEDYLVNNGTGTNLGMELTLERFFNKGFYYLLTASVFDSKYEGSDGIERNTAFNGNYVGNLLFGKEFKINTNNKLIIDLKFSAAGGRRYTPIDLQASQLAGQAVLIDSEAFSLQQKDYFRSDLKITYRINRKKVSHEVFLNIDNVLDNQNVFAQTYSARTGQIENIYQLGLFPTFQYKIQF